MSRNYFLAGTILFALIAVGCNRQASDQTANKTTAEQTVSQSATPAMTDSHGHPTAAARVPAFQIDAASLKNLGPTLPAEKFVGKTREAYLAVKEIPQTIAQLPCYCECDVGFGHKSLYSCYEDDHASHCAVCVDEVLLAYRLQKEEKLTPEQIRERIIAEYSAQR